MAHRDLADLFVFKDFRLRWNLPIVHGSSKRFLHGTSGLTSWMKRISSDVLVCCLKLSCALRGLPSWA
jgi:hypothetical protein